MLAGDVAAGSVFIEGEILCLGKLPVGRCVFRIWLHDESSSKNKPQSLLSVEVAAADGIKNVLDNQVCRLYLIFLLFMMACP
jgi:hypothetical protein